MGEGVESVGVIRNLIVFRFLFRILFPLLLFVSIPILARLFIGFIPIFSTGFDSALKERTQQRLRLSDLNYDSESATISTKLELSQLVELSLLITNLDLAHFLWC